MQFLVGVKEGEKGGMRGLDISDGKQARDWRCTIK